MRFSIRWMLALVAYVALVTTAIATGSYLLADVVWGLTLVAVCYAMVVAWVDRGRRQAMAVGFVIMAALHVAGLYVVPNRVPAARAFVATGYYLSDSDGEVYVYEMTRPGTYQIAPGGQSTLRVANAIVTLVAGVVGCFVGRAAYRGQSRSDAPGVRSADER
jgi:hypothetical protein